MAGDGVDGHGRGRRGPRDSSSGRARCPGSTTSRNSRAGSPSRSISPCAHSPVRASSSPVVEAAVRLVDQLAGQPQREQVGHERDPVGGRQRGRALVGQQLEDGVDRHRLDAGGGVELLGRARGRRRARPCPRCARRGSGTGRPSTRPLLVEQRVVHAPAVDADAGQRPVARAARRPSSASANRCRRFQRSPSGSVTGRLGKRWTSSSSTRPSVQVARPARGRSWRPRSIAAYAGSGKVEDLLQALQAGVRPLAGRQREELGHLRLPAGVDVGRLHRRRRRRAKSSVSR